MVAGMAAGADGLIHGSRLSSRAGRSNRPDQVPGIGDTGGARRLPGGARHILTSCNNNNDYVMASG